MLDLTQILTFALALGVAAFIPGPGITTLVARSVGGGSVAGFATLAGLIAGDLMYLSFAVFGLAILAKSYALVFTLVKVVATAYLVLLAWRFWHAKPEVLEVKKSLSKRDLWSSFISGLLVTISNPKTITFYMALLPMVVDLSQITVTHWAFGLVPTSIVVLLCVGGFYLLAAMSARRILSSTR
jgi:threonine/homoserine/homoserine lactone efflux protein